MTNRSEQNVSLSNLNIEDMGLRNALFDLQNKLYANQLHRQWTDKVIKAISVDCLGDEEAISLDAPICMTQEIIDAIKAHNSISEEALASMLQFGSILISDIRINQQWADELTGTSEEFDNPNLKHDWTPNIAGWEQNVSCMVGSWGDYYMIPLQNVIGGRKQWMLGDCF